MAKINNLIIAWILAFTATALAIAISFTMAGAQSNFAYYVDIQIQNTNAGSITSRIGFPINSAILSSGGFTKSDATDTELTLGGNNVQLMATNVATNASTWYSGIITLAGSSNNSYRLYMGDPTYTRDQKLTSMNTDTVTITDNANLTITDNLTLQASNTYLTSAPTSTQYYIRRQNQYELAVTPTQYQFSVTLPATTPLTGADLVPNAEGGNGSWTPIGAPADGQRYTHINAPGAAKYIDWGPAAGANSSSYPVTDLYPSYVNSVFIGVTAFRVGGDAASQIRPKVTVGGNTTLGTYVTIDAGGFVEVIEQLARPGGGLWQPSDILSMTPGFDINIAGVAAEVQVDYFRASVAYSTATTASTVSGAITTASNKSIVGRFDSAGQRILVDGAMVASIPYVQATYSTATNMSWSYTGLMDDLRIGDTSVASPTWRLAYDFAPNRINSNTIFDTSAGGNHATITFAGNPSGVTASVNYLQLANQAISSSVIVNSGGPQMLPAVVYIAPQTSTMNTDTFGYAPIKAIFDMVGWPEVMVLGLYRLIFAAILFLAALFIIKFGMGWFMATGVTALIIGVAWYLGIYPWWMEIAVIPCCIIFIMMDKNQGVFA